jgi:hypothetical protein
MASKVFDNYNLLVKYLENNILLDMQKIGEEVKNVLRNNVRVLFYERNGMNWTPEDYTRTYELIDSLTVTPVKKIGNKYEVSVYFDDSKINPYKVAGEWSAHESVVTGADISQNLPFYMEYGNQSPLYSYKPTSPPVETTIQELKDDNYIKERLKELLEMQGYKVIG